MIVFFKTTEDTEITEKNLKSTTIGPNYTSKIIIKFIQAGLKNSVSSVCSVVY